MIQAHIGLRGVAAIFVVAYHLQFGSTYHLPFERAVPVFARSYLFVNLFYSERIYHELHQPL